MMQNENNEADASNKVSNDYTIKELLLRTDEAYAELEAGGGIDGENFFADIKQSVMSR